MTWCASRNAVARSSSARKAAEATPHRSPTTAPSDSHCANERDSAPLLPSDMGPEATSRRLFHRGEPPLELLHGALDLAVHLLEHVLLLPEREEGALEAGD